MARWLGINRNIQPDPIKNGLGLGLKVSDFLKSPKFEPQVKLKYFYHKCVFFFF